MTCRRRFRILMPEGKLSGDSFVLPPEQPRNLRRGYTMLIHERSGTFLTVHDTRLLPAEAAGAIPIVDAPLCDLRSIAICSQSSSRSWRSEGAPFPPTRASAPNRNNIG